VDRRATQHDTSATIEGLVQLCNIPSLLKGAAANYEDYSTWHLVLHWCCIAASFNVRIAGLLELTLHE